MVWVIVVLLCVVLWQWFRRGGDVPDPKRRRTSLALLNWSLVHEKAMALYYIQRLRAQERRRHSMQHERLVQWRSF